MALKATIYKANVQFSDLDRNLYSDHNLTIARHPSETDERMMIRVLAYTLNAPANNDLGTLELGKDMWDPDEPAMWQKDLTGLLLHWIEVGQPDEKRISRASSRARKVSIYSFNSATASWWSGVSDKVSRIRHLNVWQIPAEQSQQLGGLAQRSMNLQITLQDGGFWISEGERSVEITPTCLFGGTNS